MSHVWYAIPSARPSQEANWCLDKWREQGYKIAVLRNFCPEPVHCDMTFTPVYVSYPHSVNWLCKTLLQLDPAINVIVTGGDDMEPDPHHTAQQIETQFLEHFPDTFGVMQPCGDSWMKDKNGTPAAARICGSPWIGRKFIRTAYQGQGPMCEEYLHFYEDEELHDVAEILGCLWLRPDLTHLHSRHWLRIGQRRPPHLENAQRGWDKDQAVFFGRKAKNFPGHESLTEAQLCLFV